LAGIILIVNKSTDHDVTYFDLFFTTISTSKTLIDNGKSANQIARLAAIVICGAEKFEYFPALA